MDWNQYILPLAGGLIIGVAASSLLLFQGRIFGISGILGGLLLPKAGDTAWRAASIGGFVFAGLLFRLFYPAAFFETLEGPIWRYAVAGLLVGFGTQMGSGCTSGHGVCGISRQSPRSILATITFISAGVIMVSILRSFGLALN